jgi:hypothetical protein
MSKKVTDLFTIDQLKALDPKQLDILRDAMVSEIRTSREIHDILKRNLDKKYDELKK